MAVEVPRNEKISRWKNGKKELVLLSAGEKRIRGG